MNIYQDSRTLLWVLEMKSPRGTWFRRGIYGSYPDAGFAARCAYPIQLEVTARIDGPSYTLDQQLKR